MLKGGIINPMVNYYLSTLCDNDSVLVADAAIQLPKDVERVDLAFMPNIPEIYPVVKGLLEKTVVDKMIIASEAKEASPELFEKYQELFNDIKIECVPHEEFLKLSKNTKFVVRTGEFKYHYSSVILISGCPY